MEKRVLTVLRSGGDFRPEHVRALARQVKQWMPEAKFYCLTDVDIPGIDCIPLKHDWPGWYSKIELLREDLGGDFLYTDLDNVVLEDISDLWMSSYTTQRGGWNALMYVPKGGYQRIYEEFRHAPGEHIALTQPTGANGKPFGDAQFMADRLISNCWEDAAPGRVVNICELRAPWPFGRTKPPAGTGVLLCSRRYGRPWDLPEWRDLYAES